MTDAYERAVNVSPKIPGSAKAKGEGKKGKKGKGGKGKGEGKGRAIGRDMVLVGVEKGCKS